MQSSLAATSELTAVENTKKVFQSIFRYVERIGNTEYVLEWKSKGFSDESIKSPSAQKEY